jgi:hypothetical protein
MTGKRDLLPLIAKRSSRARILMLREQKMVRTGSLSSGLPHAWLLSAPACYEFQVVFGWVFADPFGFSFYVFNGGGNLLPPHPNDYVRTNIDSFFLV